MLRNNLKFLTLAAALLATPAFAQNATQQLVSQANYWHDQGRDDLAADTWNKLLSIDPNQPDALQGLGQIALAQGKQAEARRHLQKLQEAHPDSPQAKRLKLVLGSGGQQGGDRNLSDARRAATAGRYADAVRFYEASFGSGKAPPSHLALEYYQSLAGTPQGWAKARDGLQALHVAEPNNGSVSLALAQVLTYREPSRREGISQLRALAQKPDTAGPARNSLRQALLWLEAGNADTALYQDYLASNPKDAEVAAKLAQAGKAAEARVQDAEGIALGEGFKALQAGELAQAEARFKQVLRARPRDAEALGGLGSVRLRQQRFAEAAELLQPAASANGKWASAYNAARYWEQLRQVEALREAGNSAQALRLAQQSVALLPNEATGHATLGSLQLASDRQGAEASFRKALSLDAGNIAARQGLVTLYGQQGRPQEAIALFDQLTPAQQAQMGGRGRLRSSLARSRAKDALAAGDQVAAQGALEAAMVDQPGDAWVRLDLARLYQQAGRPDQARSVMDGLMAVHAEQPEARYANALFAQESGDWAGAYASLSQIPAAARTAEMTQLHDVAWIEQQAAQARALVQQGHVPQAQQLVSRTETALGDRAVQPALQSALAGAWADAGNAPRALGIAQRLAGDTPTVESRLQYADVLLRAHQDAELSAVLRQLQSTTLTPEQARRYQALRTGYVLRQVDALRELGNLESAYEALSPVLAAQPQDAEAQAALARLYVAAGDHAQALALYRQILQRRPNDVATLQSAATSAAAQSDLDQAVDYLQRALVIAPDSPDVLATAGRVYRSAGKNRKAEQYFHAALAAQQRQADQVGNGLPGAAPSALVAGTARSSNPFAGMSGPTRRSAAVFSDAVPRSVALAPVQPAFAPLPAAASSTLAISDDPLPPVVQATAASAPSGASYASYEAAPATVAYASAPLPTAGARRQPARPVTSGNPVLDELRQVQSDSASTLVAGASNRSRDGESGLGALNDLEMPLQADFGVGDGKLGVSITPTLLDAGTLSTAYDIGSRFGGGPQAALADALARDSDALDTLLGSTLYRGLLTTGDNAATRNLIYDSAVASGQFQTLFNEAEGSTAAERRAAALEALYATPLAQYMLGRDLSTLSIGAIASQVLGDPSLTADMAASDSALLTALAQSSASTQTATQFQNTLYALAGAGEAARRMPQDGSGVGVGVRYRNGGFSADLGTTPLGFQEQRVLGGVGYRGQAGDAVTWSVEGSRRSVTDSLLSFAGARDARTGDEWGGVTSTGASASITVDNGLVGGYANLAAHRLRGRNVADNDHRQVDLGVYVHALDTTNQSLTAGINLTALQYDKNLSGFTYGHGGYFSPQEYFDLDFPVHWTGRAANQKVNWNVDASIGVQHFSTDTVDYFPTDASLQQRAYDAASMAALLGLVNEFTAPVYAGQNKTGVSYNLTGGAEWQVAPQLFLGGRMTVNNARDFNQFNAAVYLRLVLDRLGAALGRAPQPPSSP